MKNKYLFLSIILLTSLSTFAQITGKIKGQIIDGSNKEGLIGAYIKIQGTTLGTVTDIEGKFEINRVPVGKYSLEISSIGYKQTTIQNLVVEPEKVTLISQVVEEDEKQLQEVIVVGTKNRGSEIAVISQIKEAKQIVSGISAEQILKSQDRDAAEVVKRIPGVTIVDNRFINIRGLNERYNAVWLNDAVAPSSETDRKAFSFDIVPSNLLDRVLIFKTPSPELPGDFAGGAVKVYTRQPSYSEKSLTVSLSSSFRQGTTFQPFTQDVSNNYDWLGFGYQSRKLGSVTADNTGSITGSQLQNFKNTYKLSENNASPDIRFNASYLSGFKIGTKTFASLSAITYSSTSTKYDINRLDVYRENLLNRDTQNTSNVKLGLMQNFVYSLKNGGKIEFRNLFNQISRNQVTLRNSFDENGLNQTKYSYAMGYQSRQTYNAQLAGLHNFSIKQGLKIDWVVGYASSMKQEPDYRRIQYNYQSKQAIIPQSGVDLFSGSRLYQNLKENIYSFNLNANQNLNENISLNIGTYIENKIRAFDARQFGYSLSAFNTNYNSFISQPINSIFETSNLEANTGFKFEEDGNSIATQAGVKPNYSYGASNHLAAGYLSSNFNYDAIKILVGARFEHNVQSINAGLNGTKIDQSVTTDKLLPSINFSYNFTEKALLRIAYGRTLNRPEFREWAPFVYYDFDVNALNYGSLYLPSAGNGSVGTLLKVADIDNFDLRYEYYPNDGENIHVGVFYKKFTNPIEASISNNPSNLAFTYTNAPKATAFGAEVDIRKRLNFTNSTFLKNISVLFNASLIKSQVDVNDQQSWTAKRKLQGQSPYIINTGIYYQPKNWQVSVLYNVFGERIVYIGSGNPAISEVVEMPRNTIDISVSRNVNKNLSVNGGISNLLNQRVLMLQDSPDNKNNKFERNSDPHFVDYKPGSYYTLGLKYSF